MSNTLPTAQEAFNALYITSSEIQRELGVTRSAIMYARKRGELPVPINVNKGQLMLWVRGEVAPYLDKWKRIIEARRCV